MPLSLFNRRTRQGSVIVLVVAVLVLLVVIGTVFIVSARSERNTAAAMSTAANLTLARQGVMDIVKQTVGTPVYDAGGQLGGSSITGTFGGTLAARNYDYPEIGTTFGKSNANANIPDEPWLAAKLHVQTAGSDLSLLTPKMYNPSSGAYDIAPVIFPYDATNLKRFSTVVADQTASVDTGDDPPTDNADAYINLLSFTDASGIHYRYGLRILDTNRMANLNTGATDDAAAITDKNGIYLTSVRLAANGASPSFGPVNAFYNTSDTAANLHASPSPSGLGRAGLSVGNATFSLAGWQTEAFYFENPKDPALTLFDLSDELELRSYGEFGTAYTIRPAVGGTSPYLTWPSTLGCVSSPGTANVVGNPSRRNYTTYSWSRAFRPYPDVDSAKRFSLGAGTGTTPLNVTGTGWPALPACISANPQVSIGAPDDEMYYTAMTASNIATLMEYSTGAKNVDGSANTYFSTITPADSSISFTHEETCAFVANYCTAKWNGFVADPNVTTNPTTSDPVQAYFLPAGPSFVDGTGICIRSATGNDVLTSTVHREFGGGTNDVRAESADKVYLGYSAQPYFSELAASLLEDDTGATPVVVAGDVAIELYNPYPVALSLYGYHIKSGDGLIDIDLTKDPATGKDLYIPANGFFIVTSSSSHFAMKTTTGTPVALGDNVTQYVFPGLKINVDPTGSDTTFTLYRAWYPRSTPPGAAPTVFAPVDKINYKDILTVPGTPPLPLKSAAALAADFSIARAGGTWGPTVNPATFARLDTVTTPQVSLGAPNAGGGGFPLPDRYAGWGVNSSNSAQGSPFGLGEFARIIRLSHEFSATDPANPAPIGSGLISDHVALLSPATVPYSSMTANSQIDAQILFDFYADARIYNTTPATDNPTVPAAQRHDIRATRLLDQLAFIDRVSQFTIDIGNGVTDINKIRLPGQININTASGDVLRAIPNMTNQLVANIIAYRQRSVANAVSYGAGSSEGAKQNTLDFSDITKYPGTGIRSLAELLNAVSDTTATTIEQRDLSWGPLCAVSTVRSDTFVVYGYLEAVRRHPNLSAGTADDWYSTNITEDPSSTTANLLRVANRRFIAIIDRSYCNYASTDPKFSLPRILAIKDLPR